MLMGPDLYKDSCTLWEGECVTKNLGVFQGSGHSQRCMRHFLLFSLVDTLLNRNSILEAPGPMPSAAPRLYPP